MQKHSVKLWVAKSYRKEQDMRVHVLVASLILSVITDVKAQASLRHTYLPETDVGKSTFQKNLILLSFNLHVWGLALPPESRF